jgi:hypothetical protein
LTWRGRCSPTAFTGLEDDEGDKSYAFSYDDDDPTVSAAVIDSILKSQDICFNLCAGFP